MILEGPMFDEVQTSSVRCINLEIDSTFYQFNKNCCRNSWVGGSFISRPLPVVHNMVLAIANDQLQTGMQVCSPKLKVRRG